VSIWVRLREHPALRYGRIALAIAIVLLAAAVITSVTVDLGPALRGLAEREGSRQLQRPVHIGSLAVRLVNGRVEIGDLVVEGLKPEDRPFFTAKRLSLSLDWSNLLPTRPELVITSVEKTDWDMLVEKFDEGDNFPRFRRSNRPPSSGPRRFRTTLRYFQASRGQFTYEDHEAPWSIRGPNLEINITNYPRYHGEASFTGGLVSIQQYEPMWADFSAAFTIDGSNLTLDRIDLKTDGAVSSATGVVEMNHWPEQTYQVVSRVGFHRMREIFFARENWNLSGDGDFTGVFHLFKGGPNLSGQFTSREAGLNQ
jgi:hypothetical protein